MRDNRIQIIDVTARHLPPSSPVAQPRATARSAGERTGSRSRLGPPSCFSGACDRRVPMMGSGALAGDKRRWPSSARPRIGPTGTRSSCSPPPPTRLPVKPASLRPQPRRQPVVPRVSGTMWNSTRSSVAPHSWPADWPPAATLLRQVSGSRWDTRSGPPRHPLRGLMPLLRRAPPRRLPRSPDRPPRPARPVRPTPRRVSTWRPLAACLAALCSFSVVSVSSPWQSWISVPTGGNPDSHSRFLARPR